ncbi:MAG: metallophosphoesterase [Spirochaetales bacterium]|nr:metallophosphoesterase [Spirochaetales bacterium]
MRILCLTDIHGASTQPLITKLKNTDIDLVLISGDITQKGAEKEALEVLEPFLKRPFPLFCVSGNMDYPGVDEVLVSKSIQLHGKGVVFQEIGFFGCGGSNPTPFRTPHELMEEQIAQTLEQAYGMIKNQPVKVLICHAPPYQSECDRIVTGAHCGSRSVRNFLENHDVDFCLCGHIHESFGQGYVGKTLCINPGAYNQGRWMLVENSGQNFELLKRSNL